MEFATACSIIVRRKRLSDPTLSELKDLSCRNCTFVPVKRHFYVGACRRAGTTRRLWLILNFSVSAWRAA